MPTSEDDGVRWYAVQCKGGESFRASENLQRQGYDIYHPQISVEKRRRGRDVAVAEPLFPAYLFIALSPQANRAPIRSTRGVVSLVAFGGEPIALPEGLIETLMAREGSLAESGTRPLLQPGQAIEITEGPFRELQGRLMQCRGEERVIVLLELLQREHRVSLGRHQVRPAGV
ncbi:transcription/translation regulatory transformer protein RfaH [Kushneria aurantia]|uniref:Transcription/translation regulatory transformer protein RfaH n=1 Tax=Kushneria aurantia TaxID=504092 RepID=A0ABV6G715_9GAMM|nr:transcription/translation regulatory transformer protein RfaH [Kushneria aurantia]